MNLQVGALSNKGKVRSSNEDNFCLNGWHLPQKHGTMQQPMLKIYNTKDFIHFGVFDGMGGYQAGDRASYLAATMEETIPGLQYEPDLGQMFSVICREANLRICSEMELLQGPTGSTASLLGFYQNDLYLCNIGDSPIFRLRDHTILQLSLEHSERSIFEQTTGKKTDYHQKFALTQNLGISPSDMVIEPYESKETVQNGDRYLICSDGITDMISQDQIQRVLDSGESIERTLRTLEQDALQAGGKDNLTMILIEVQEEEAPEVQEKPEKQMGIQGTASRVAENLKQFFKR